MGHAAKRKRDSDPELSNKLREIFCNTLNLSHTNGKIRYDNFTGKKHTDAAKNLIGEKNKIRQTGSGNSQFGTKWITNGNENKKISNLDELPTGWKYGRTIKEVDKSIIGL